MFASLAVLFALLVPMVGTANAALADDLECLPEQSQNATGATHVITCYLLTSADVGKVIRFERSGDADGFSPLTPDATDNVGAVIDAPNPPDDDALVDDVAYDWAAGFTSATVQTETITAWVDDDNDISTLDFDTAEGRDEATTPGNVSPEPDETEVVEKTWFAAAPAGLRVDCDDESGDDTQTNPAGQSETYTCHAYSDVSGVAGVQDGTDTNVSGLAIDAENLNGANDPDNSAATGTADFNNACTTDASGNCTFVLAPSESQIGSADVCFWGDVDTDNAFSTAAGIYDGFNCSEAVGAAENGDETDKVNKTWAAVGVTPAVLDASPEVDNNPSGPSTPHTVTAVVVDQFGTPVPNALVDFSMAAGSRNVALGTICDNVLTNASGTATCTYSDTGTAVSSGADEIDVYVDSTLDAGEVRGDVDSDTTDVVAKIWTAGGPPAAAATVIDMDGAGASGGAADCIDTAVGTPSAVGTTHPVCGDVVSSVPAAIPGASATFTTNLGFFTNGLGDNLGQSFTTTTDENGEAFALLASTEAGQATVTLTSGAASDSGTVLFTALTGRNIDCSPDTADNPTGTTHIISCLVTDRFGNPTDGVGAGDDEVFFTETGAGRIDSDVSPVIGADGTVEVIISTTNGEEGTQSIMGELELDLPDSDLAADLDDACDQAANDGDTAGPGPADPGAPAGNCEETVEKVWTDAPPVGEDHARTLHLNKAEHVNLGGERSLKWAGLLSTDDGLAQCSASQQIKVQIRAGGSWITRKSDTTNSNGKFSVLIRDIAKKYRAVAPKSSFTDDDGAEQTCLRAVSNVRRHRHGSGGGGGAKFVR